VAEEADGVPRIVPGVGALCRRPEALAPPDVEAPVLAGQPRVRDVVPPPSVLVKALDRLNHPGALAVIGALLVLAAGVVDDQASLPGLAQALRLLAWWAGAPLLPLHDVHAPEPGTAP
jgi:hypothetical protein